MLNPVSSSATSILNSVGKQSPLLTLPNDVLNLIFEKYFKAEEALPCLFINRRFSQLQTLKKLSTIQQHKLESTKNRVRIHRSLGYRVLHDSDDAICKPLVSAAKCGSIPLVIWYHNLLKYPLNNYLCPVAAQYGHLSLLQWLRNSTASPSEQTRLGSWLKWIGLIKSSIPHWDESTCAAAAFGGHLSLLQWVRENGCPWDEETCWAAASGGHLPVLQWIRTQGCPWDIRTCKPAALQGRLDILQWAHANGCPWNEETCETAAKGGHLAVLRWLHDNGCPWNEKTYLAAEQNGDPNFLEWLREKDCPRES